VLLRVIHRLLEQPVVFDTYQRLVGAPACHRAFVRDWVRPRPGERLLDLGCGVGASLDDMPAGIDYTGIDINTAYIDEARRRYPGRGRFLVGDVASFDLPGEAPFDRAMAFGVLHHVDDVIATQMFALAARLCRPGAEMVLIEPAYVPGQPVLGKWLIDRDRGRHVRTAEAYQALAAGFGAVELAVVHDLLNIPYTQAILRVRLGG
jgi:SAM-dependent methyltransferase